MKKLLSCITSAAMALSALPVLAVASAGDTVTPLQVLALGDSITTGYGISTTGDLSYSELVADGLHSSLTNLAKDGATTTDLLNKIKTEEATQKAIADADVICISIGGNNVMQPALAYLNEKYLAYCTSVGKEVSYKEFLRALMADKNAVTTMALDLTTKINPYAKSAITDLPAIEKAIKDANSDAKVVFQTVYNPVNAPSAISGGTDYSKELAQLRTFVGGQLDKINTALKSCSGSYVVDVAAEFQGQEWIYTNMDIATSEDDLDVHPNSLGHAVIGATILQELGVSGYQEKFSKVYSSYSNKLTDAQKATVQKQLKDCAFGSVTYKIGAVTGEVGSTVVVPVTVTGDTGSAGIKLEFAPDSTLSFQKFKNGEVYSSEPQWNKNTQTYVWGSPDGKNQQAVEDAVLMYLTYQVPANSVNGLLPIDFNLKAGCETTDTNGTPLNVTYVNGGVTVTGGTDLKLGDISMNGVVDTDDAVIAMKYYAKTLIGDTLPLTDAQKQAADVNEDGMIDTSDAVYIMRYYAKSILGEANWDDILKRH